MVNRASRANVSTAPSSPHVHVSVLEAGQTLVPIRLPVFRPQIMGLRMKRVVKAGRELKIGVFVLFVPPLPGRVRTFVAPQQKKVTGQKDRLNPPRAG